MKKLLVPGAFALSLLLIASSAYAVSLPNGSAVFETSLASRITSTDTTMTLVTNSANGETVNGYDCFTIDEGRTDAEYVCGTVSGTSVTGLERGISYANGTTTSASRAHIHRTGANVKKTDFPLIQRVRNILNAVEGLPGAISYATHPTFTSNTQLVDLQQLNATAFGSVPVIVNSGGTGNTSLASGGLLQGAGTSAVVVTFSPTVSNITATSTATSSFAGPISNTYSGLSTSTFSGNLSVFGTTTQATTTISNLTVSATTTLNGAVVFGGSATTSVTNFQATNNATTTNLFISGACTGCSLSDRYLGSTTPIIASANRNYTSSTGTKDAVVLYVITGSISGGAAALRGQLIVPTVGATSIDIGGVVGDGSGTDKAQYTVSWSGADLNISRTSMTGTVTLSGNVYWYK